MRRIRYDTIAVLRPRKNSQNEHYTFFFFTLKLFQADVSYSKRKTVTVCLFVAMINLSDNAEI